jgi:hypothetical protein
VSDIPENLTLELLRTIRRENADFRTLLLGLVTQGQRLERRMGELDRRMIEMRGEVELMLKSEVMGRESRIERLIEALSERVAALEAHQS